MPHGYPCGAGISLYHIFFEMSIGLALATDNKTWYNKAKNNYMLFSDR